MSDLHQQAHAVAEAIRESFPQEGEEYSGIRVDVTDEGRVSFYVNLHAEGDDIWGGDPENDSVEPVRSNEDEGVLPEELTDPVRGWDLVDGQFGLAWIRLTFEKRD